MLTHLKLGFEPISDKKDMLANISINFIQIVECGAIYY